MGQFLADAPLGALLGLMLFPLTGALLLGAYIAFVFVRKNKKSKMKHGIPLDNQPDTDLSIDVPLPASYTSPESSTINNEQSVGPTPAQPQQKSTKNQPQTTSFMEDRLNLALLNSAPDMDNKETDPVNPRKQEQPLLSSPLPTDMPTEPIEMLRLLRHPQSKQLILEVGGKRYHKLTDITDKSIGQYILQITAHLLAFTNGMIVTKAGMNSVLAPKVGQLPQPIAPVVPPLPSPSLSSPPGPAPESESEAAFLASLQEKSVTPPPPEPKAKRGLFSLGSAKPKPASVMPIPSLNLADEINDIVQARLKYSPPMQNTRIEISSDPSGGIKILVDNQVYSSPDEIPDPTIKTLIKESIKEWERS